MNIQKEIESITWVDNDTWCMFLLKFQRQPNLHIFAEHQALLGQLKVIIRDDIHMCVAHQIARKSTCSRKKVGALLTRPDGSFVSSGHNGVPRKKLECHQYFGQLYDSSDELKSQFLIYEDFIRSDVFKTLHRKFSEQNEIHAEANVLLRSTPDEMNGSYLYMTLSPCMSCAKLIVAAKLDRVYFSEKYDRDVSGINYLKNNGVRVIEMTKKIGVMPNNSRG